MALDGHALDNFCVLCSAVRRSLGVGLRRLVILNLCSVLYPSGGVAVSMLGTHSLSYAFASLRLGKPGCNTTRSGIRYIDGAGLGGRLASDDSFHSRAAQGWLNARRMP